MAAVLAAGTGEIPTGFEQIAKIMPTSSATGGHLGKSVDIFENVLIVGAPYQGDESQGPGYAQVAVFSDWDGSIAETIDLSASDGAAGDLFGMRVVIGEIDGSASGSGVAYVSAPGRAGEGVPSYAGAVYVFAGDGGDVITEITTLTPFDGDASRRFGTSLFFDGGRLAVGAPYDGTAGAANHGAAYIYTLGVDGIPTHSERVQCDTPTANQYFGWSIAIDGDRMAVGAIVDSAVEYQAGAVYVFERQPDDSWDQIEIVAPAGLATGDWHGTDVAISGDLLVTSSINFDHVQGDDVFSNSGVVHVFKWDGVEYQQVQQILPPLMDLSIAWGGSLDFDGAHLVIGGDGWDNNGDADSGAAAVYEYDPDNHFINPRVIIGSDVVALAHFGTSVAVHGDRVAVGSREDQFDYGGSVYIFEPACGGDLDYDGLIDHDDILDVVQSWGDSSITTADVVQDFDVNIHDLLIVLQYYGTCG
ncbi:MAG: hypothetical protein QF471_06485 [Phycisphaerales bacterium]|jgi:hypothetical protein|nr:hypothetical protein [Phycisphaerales bacterium]